MIHLQTKRAQDVDANHGASCVHTLVPLYISNLCGCSLGHLQNRVDLGNQYQLPVVSQGPFVCQDWSHLVFHKAELWEQKFILLSYGL